MRVLEDTSPTSFAQKYKAAYEFENDLTWLQSPRHIKHWDRDISRKLGVTDRVGRVENGWTTNCQKFADFLRKPIGAVTYHMWFLTAYELPCRFDLQNKQRGLIGAMAVNTTLNTSGNELFENETLQRLFSLKFSNRRGKPILSKFYAPMMARLFNYYECELKDRDWLFKLSAMGIPNTDKCVACGTVQNADGHVVTGPTTDVDASTWHVGLRLKTAGRNKEDKDTI